MTRIRTRTGRTLHLVLLLLLVLTGLSACGDSDQTEDGDTPADGDLPVDGDLPPDGDQPPDGDLPPDGDDGDIPPEDGDLDPDPDDDPDPEIPEDGDLDEDSGTCPEDSPLASCFENGAPGTAGTLCQRAGGHSYLVYCEPTQPQFPTCRSTCSCTTQQRCDAGCLDIEKSGLAACIPPEDGDLDPDGDLDGDEDGDDPDGDDPDGDDPDGDDPDGDDPDGDLEPFVCLPDALEPNNSLTGARLVEPGFYPGLSLCSGDNDWFKVAVRPGDALDARIEFEGRRANLDLILIDRFGQVVMRSEQNPSDYEAVWVTAAYEGVYYLLVYSANLAEAPYTLLVELDPAVDGDEDWDGIEIDDIDIDKDDVEICPEDSFAPNHSTASAALVPVGVRHENLRRCPGADDFYRLDLQQGDYVSINVEFYNYLGNLDVYVIHPSGSYVVTWVSNTNNESGAFTATQTGVYLVQVLGRTTGVENSYNLTISIQPVQGCSDDAFEPNDNLGSATLLTTGSYPGLRLCPYNVDWYAVDIPANSSLVATVIFSHTLEGNIDAALYNASQVLLGVGDSITDNERIVYYSETARRVYLEVFAAGTRERNYALQLEIFPGAICPGDRMEPNNTFETAYPILAGGTYTPLMLCAEDFDWYRFTLNTNNYLTVKVFYNRALGPVLLTIYNEQQQGLAYHNNLADGVETFIQAPAPGVYRMEMFSFSLQDIAYTMQVSICPEDTLEPNDTYRTSTYLSGSTVTLHNLAICRGNEDWFAADIYAGQRVIFTVAHDWRLGDLDAFMRDDSLNIVAQSAQPTGDAVIDYTAPRTGSYYFQVRGHAGAENSYSIYYMVQ